MTYKPSLQFRIIGLVLIVILLILGIVGYLFNLTIEKSVEDRVGQNAMDIARLLSELPDIRQAMELPDPSSYLQPRTQELKAKTHASFITILDRSGIRYTHNDTTLIGKPFTGGDEGPSLLGEEYISTAVGISGRSIRAFVPVKKDEKVIGVITVGMFDNNIFEIVHTYFTSIIYSLFIGLALGILLAIGLAKSIKKSMYGLEPDEIANILRQRESLLNCLHEGVIAVDKNRKVSLINETAQKILSLDDHMVGKPIEELIPSSKLSDVMDTKETDYNSEMTINQVTVIVNRAPIIVNNEVVGAVSTFRDITEIRNLAEELTGVKQYMEGLRAKTHEFMNRLHTVHGLLELQEYEEAKSFILQTTEGQQKLLKLLTSKIQDPKTSALLLGKIQQAEERSITLKLDPGSHIPMLPPKISNSMVVILGNLIDNAMDAVEGKSDGTVEVTLLDSQKQWTVMVEDNGCGIRENQIPLIFKKRYSTKNTDRGYGLFLIKNHIDNVLSGQIQVTSTPNQGTVFVITIPKHNRLYG